jgi:hypothetical protein
MDTKKQYLITVALFSLAGGLVMMMSNSFVYINSPIKSTSDQLFFQQAFAQSAPNSTSANTSNNSNHADSDQTILRQGLVTSSQARHNETSHISVILPQRDDGKSYSGVLTFSASQPVDVTLLQRLSIDNGTLSQIDFKKYGELTHKWIRDIPSQHNLNQTALQVISALTPSYGTSTPYYSASIPFVASGVALWSQAGTPFIAAYQVTAKLAQPEIVNNIEDKNKK